MSIGRKRAGHGADLAVRTLLSGKRVHHSGAGRGNGDNCCTAWDLSRTTFQRRWTSRGRTSLPDGMVERMSRWAKDHAELPNLLFEISWEYRRQVRGSCWCGWQTGELSMKIVLQCRERARCAYNHAVSEVNREIPLQMLTFEQNGISFSL